MIATVHANAEILELRKEVRVNLDRGGLISIYRDLVAEATAAYVLGHSFFSNQLTSVDVHMLNSRDNFKIAMRGEKMIIVIPAALMDLSSLRRHYCRGSRNDIPPRMGALAQTTSELLAQKTGVPVTSYLFLHDLEAVLLMHPG